MKALLVTFLVPALGLGGVGAWAAGSFAVDPDYGLSRLLMGWHDSRLATFHRLFERIEKGMTVDEVWRTVQQLYPEGGDRVRPGFEQDALNDAIVLFMNPEDQREPNAEGIFLRLEGGRVARKDYSMD